MLLDRSNMSKLNLRKTKNTDPSKVGPLLSLARVRLVDACESCWQHDIFVAGRDVTWWAISATFMAGIIAKKRGIPNCYGKERALQRWEDEKKEFFEAGNVQVVNSWGGQWDTGQSPTQVSTTSTSLSQWEASIQSVAKLGKENSDNCRVVLKSCQKVWI